MVPAFFPGAAGLKFANVPSAGDNPAAAWSALPDADIQTKLIAFIGRKPAVND